MVDSTLIEFVVVGVPTWALVDGTWSMLSQLANHCPEGYAISSYLILCLTVGNLVPLALGFALKNYSSIATRKLIRLILLLGLGTGILMSFFWEHSIALSSGKRISLPLYVLFFVVGACSSSSNVTHFTFVSRYDAINTTALAAGMGIGSMFAGLLAIAQGLELEHMGYSVRWYYLTLALLYVPAIFALRMIPSARDDSDTDSKTSYSSIEEQSVLVNVPIIERYTPFPNSPRAALLNSFDESEFLRVHRSVLLVQMFNSTLGYGFVPALISLACAKFNDRTLVLLLATGITAVLDPSFKALTAIKRIQSVRGLIMSAVCLSLMTVGLLICAALPPRSPLFDHAGGVVPILLYTSFQATFGFSNTSVYRYFKDHVPQDCIHHSYRWSGVASQSGALIGSLLAFILVISGAFA